MECEEEIAQCEEEIARSSVKSGWTLPPRGKGGGVINIDGLMFSTHLLLNSSVQSEGIAGLIYPTSSTTLERIPWQSLPAVQQQPEWCFIRSVIVYYSE